MIKRPVAELAREVILIQDACNFSGLSLGFIAARDDLLASVPTHELAAHPVMQMWVLKLHQLTIGECLCSKEMERYGEAYAKCRALTGLP